MINSELKTAYLSHQKCATLSYKARQEEEKMDFQYRIFSWSTFVIVTPADLSGNN